MAFLKPVPLTTRPSVTVVVPCYNYGRYLDQVVASIRAQRDLDIEIIIVDDASPDGSADVVRRLAATTAGVTALCHADNMGHITTYNDGLARATGDYVVLLSADDLLPPDALTRAVALLEAQPNVGFVYGFARSFSGAPPSTADGRVRNWSVWAGHDWLRRSARSGRCVIVSPEVVMRREAYEQTGGYDHRLPHSADFHLWLRTAVRWDVGRVNGPAQAWYRVHEQNMHLTTYAGWLADLEARAETFEIVFDENLAGHRHLLPLRERARAALAREARRRARASRRAGDTDLTDRYRAFAEHLGQGGRVPVWDRRPAERPQLQTLLAGGEARLEPVTRHLLWRWERRYG